MICSYYIGVDINEIIDRYYRKMYKLCLFYLGDEAEAEEVLQEIFIKILKKQHTFEKRSNIYTWVYRIAVNTLINHIKRKKIVEFISLEHIAGPGEMPGDSASSAFDPAVRLEQEEIEAVRIRQLERGIDRLSNREKTAFYLFYYDNLKQKKIAEILKTSVSAVESLIHKAKKKVRKGLYG